METVTNFIFLGSKITADGDHSYEIKRHLILRRNAVTNLDSRLKGRDITLSTNVHLVKAMFFFPVVMYVCMYVTWMWELDHKNWCFWIVMLKKTLESPLGCEEIKSVNPKRNQSWTDAEAEASPDGGHLMGATWCEEVTHWKRPWCWERLGAGEGHDRGWDGWMASLTRWTWVWASSGRWWWTGKPGVLQSTGSQRVGHDWATEQQ